MNCYFSVGKPVAELVEAGSKRVHFNSYTSSLIVDLLKRAAESVDLREYLRDKLWQAQHNNHY